MSDNTHQELLSLRERVEALANNPGITACEQSVGGHVFKASDSLCGVSDYLNDLIDTYEAVNRLGDYAPVLADVEAMEGDLKAEYEMEAA